MLTENMDPKKKSIFLVVLNFLKKFKGLKMKTLVTTIKRLSNPHASVPKIKESY